MSCSTCRKACDTVDYEAALLACPNALALGDAELVLTRAGYDCSGTEMGLRVKAFTWSGAAASCEGSHSEASLLAALRVLEAELPKPHRDTIRVALLPQNADKTLVFAAIFNAQSLSATTARLGATWLADLLREKRLQMHVQPLIHTGRGLDTSPAKHVGFETLVRGIDTEGGLIPPYKLFDAARQSDLLFVLDQRARMAAVENAGRLIRAGSIAADALIFINFLPTAIYNPEHCLRSTMRAIDAANLKPEQICFEVVESEDVGDRGHLLNILNYYRERGFRIALDDVGAGYSSLMAVSDLRPDYIKIDGELVRRAASGKLERHMLRDLIAAAHDSGIAVVSEGVETDEQLDMVLDAGTDIVQGYIFGKPAYEPPSYGAMASIVGHCNGCVRKVA